ncbi:MAG: hypothetical protein V3V15_09620 [Sphingorhabdus sp.]
MKRIIMVCAATLALASCATPETRIKNALTDAGLPKPMASCMAGRMVDRLSLLQLNKLRGLKKLRDADAQKLSVSEFVKRTKSLQDPEILGVTSSSAAICAIKQL